MHHVLPFGNGLVIQKFEDNKCGDFALKLRQGIELVFFMVALELCNMVILK
jgi:hypothetical protein